ncbi:MAG TPA: hypothetical protein VMG39_11490 [Pseudolabrys sp.]|nr:hypothetical protein [Pseudolabrys sp.]
MLTGMHRICPLGVFAVLLSCASPALAQDDGQNIQVAPAAKSDTYQGLQGVEQDMKDAHANKQRLDSSIGRVNSALAGHSAPRIGAPIRQGRRRFH